MWMISFNSLINEETSKVLQLIQWRTQEQEYL